MFSRNIPGVPPRSKITTGNVEAIEGTTITVHARTNQPAKAAYLDFGQPPTAPMEINRENPQEVTGKFLVRNDGSYTVKFRNQGGQMNPEPVLYDIRVTRDAPPSVKFTAPPARLKAPSNAKVDLDYEAADDFGVKSLVLSVYQGNESLTTPEDFLENKKPERKVAGRKTLDLAPLKLKAGSVIEYWLVVRDSKEPSANTVRTEKQIIEIEAPASPEELAKIDDQRQQNPPPLPPADPNQQQQEQRQTAANQAGNNGGGGKDQNQPANPDPDRQLAQQNPNEGDQPNPGDQRRDTDSPLDPAAQKRMDDLAKKLEKLGLNPPPPRTTATQTRIRPRIKIKIRGKTSHRLVAKVPRAIPKERTRTIPLASNPKTRKASKPTTPSPAISLTTRRTLVAKRAQNPPT